jgi:F0F1-type ATP synthase delta subunit
VFNFLGVVNNKGRTRLLGPIAQAFADLLDAGQRRVDVTVARRSPRPARAGPPAGQPVAGPQRRRHQYVVENIIGSLVLRVEDKLIDASVRYQLEAMRERLLAASGSEQSCWLLVAGC